MGNVIFSPNNPTFTVSATSSATDYSCSNLSNFTNLRRCWRSTSIAQQTLDFTFASSQSIVGVVVDDTNFISITVGGTANTLTKDTWVNRYKKYSDKTSTGSTFQIIIPNQTPTDGASYFRIGRILFVTSANKILLNQNISWPLPRTSEQPFVKTPFESGGVEIIKLGDYFAFSCTMKFNYANRSTEEQVKVINTVPMNVPIVLYENNTDTSQVYVCYKEGSISSSELTSDVVTIDSFKFVEYI